MTTRYYTRHGQVPLQPGETVGFTAGHGYYAKPAKPAPKPAPFGTRQAAGIFAGAGLMLGGDEAPWKQACELGREHLIQYVAVFPGTPAQQFLDAGLRIVTWQPPEQTPLKGVDILQAEGQAQWDAIAPLATPGIVLNDWRYGKFPARTVALVEVYANDNAPGMDFNTLPHYMEAGASAVVPVPGLYSSSSPDAVAAAIYRTLPDTPGVCGYAGEDLIAPVILEAMRDVWGRYAT